MYTSTYLLPLASLLALVNGHAVILAAQGPAGPASVGFKVDSSIARNCTGISPCQQDTTIIRQAEIDANVVNECGRTELSGNIDVGENTENALAAGLVTQVTKGSQLTVTLHQVNADGAGPFVCDLDSTSNTAVSFTNLSVTNNVPGTNGLSQNKEQDFNITVQLPTDLSCTGASTGNVCTVRCRNNALAGPFGGCFAIQQTDVTASQNNADTITTAQSLDAIEKQILENQADLPAAIQANQNSGSTEAEQGLAAVNALLSETIVSSAQATLTPAAAQATDASAATTTSSSAAAATTTSSSKKGKKNKNKNNNRRDVLRWAERIVAGSADDVDLVN